LFAPAAERGRYTSMRRSSTGLEGGDQTTNAIERLHKEFHRRVKTRGSLPSEDAALGLLFSLVVSGEMKLHRIDGWQKIAALPSQHTAVAA
jgi:Transposase, Mutator family